MRREKSIRLIGQAFIEDNVINDATDIFLAGYLQAVEDIKKEAEKKQRQVVVVDKPGIPTFEEFWKAYAKSYDKKKAQQKWNALSDEDKLAIMKHVPLYVAATQGERKQYRKYPCTYLNNRSWENEIESHARQSDLSQQEFFKGRTDLIARLNASRGNDQK